METNKNYKKLVLMLAISFAIMYAVMYLNLYSADHIFLSLTRTYMALLMVAPMAVLMLLMMPSMFTRKLLNKVIFLAGMTIFAMSLIMLRYQLFIGDRQYMKAMIPHHSSALLTSRNATITDPEVKALSEKIIESQQAEIEQMKQILKRMDEKQPTP